MPVRETALNDLASIDKVPIYMFVGTKDETCTHKRALETKAILGDTVVHFESIEGADHVYFNSANDEKFMNLLLPQLGRDIVKELGSSLLTNWSLITIAAVASVI